jgi:serine/threonine-protein kinase
MTEPAGKKVAVVARDEKTIENCGPGPWSRDRLAEAQRRINAAGPAVVAYNTSFEAPQNERGLQIMAEFRDEYGSAMNPELRRRLQQAVNRLDGDYALGAGFRDSGRVILGLQYQYRDAGHTEPFEVPERLEPHTLSAAGPEFAGEFGGWPAMFKPPGAVPLARVFLPTPKIGDNAAGWAAGDDYLDRIPGARAMPLVLPAGERYLPGLALRVTALQDGRGLSDISLEHGEGIRIGPRRIETDNAGRVYPHFYKGQNDTPALPVISIHDILQGTVPAEALAGKTVLVGLTAERFTRMHDTPLGEAMAPVMVLAHGLSGVIQGDLYRVTEWSYLLRYAGIVVVALYLMLILPRLGRGAGLAFSVLLAVLLLNVEIILMITQSVWPPMMLAVAALICGHILIEANRAMYARVHGYKQALTESNLQLGQTLQAQGHLGQAFAKYRHCATTEEVLAALYSLAEDFERKRQFNKAVEVLKFINSRRRRYRDVEARIRRNEQLDNTVMLGGDKRQSSTQTLILTDGGIKKPVLGRYELEKELGRGSMGTVYLGRDPKIGRTVAVKAMSFSDEFDEEVFEDIKARFHREASTAGRLNHPNIVTIYDVGEEKDLSYIAMDYLEGKPMSAFTKTGQLLPVDIVLDVIAQVADALGYANGKGVIHRDIKPENIVFDEQTGKPTVTDFGVACLTDASRTKTGVVLGSPSYMSPEQLAGKRIDGRSDLYSLGATLFQLLTGKLPFTADSLSSLIYKITHDKHPDIRKIHGDLPPCVATIINRALQKDPEKRYMDGSQMAGSIRRCKNKNAGES